MLADNQKITVNPMVILREDFDDWAILFNGENGQGYGLNPISVFVWKCLEQERTLDQVIEQVREAHSDIPSTVEQDVQDFVTSLIDCGLAGIVEK